MQYAGFWRRFIAKFIDNLIFYSVAFIYLVIISGGHPHTIISLLVKDAMSPADHPLLILIAGLMLYAFMLAYGTSFIASSWQATPGMRLFGMYVAKDQKRLTNQRAAGRVLLYFIPGIIVAIASQVVNDHSLVNMWFFYGIYAVWYLPIVFTKEKTAIHDMICGTRVIKGRPPVTLSESVLPPTPSSI